MNGVNGKLMGSGDLVRENTGLKDSFLEGWQGTQRSVECFGIEEFTETFPVRVLQYLLEFVLYCVGFENRSGFTICILPTTKVRNIFFSLE